MWAKTFAQSQKVYQVVYEDCQSNSDNSQELKLCQTSGGFSKSSCSTMDQNSKTLDFEVVRFWPQIATEVGSDVPQCP